MSDPQPWRNPRPAPNLPEMQARLPGLSLSSWFFAWWPALIWAAVIFSMSTDTFSSDHTASVIAPIFRWLIPSMTDDQFNVLHHFIRKSAHFTEYFIFGLFLYRGVRRGRKGWRWTWGLAALSLAAGYAIMDEVHQAFVISRTASPYDSLLDSFGAFVAIAAVWVWYRLGPSQPPAETPSIAVPTSESP